MSADAREHVKGWTFGPDYFDESFFMLANHGDIDNGAVLIFNRAEATALHKALGAYLATHTPAAGEGEQGKDAGHE